MDTKFEDTEQTMADSQTRISWKALRIAIRTFRFVELELITRMRWQKEESRSSPLSAEQFYYTPNVTGQR